MQSYSVVCIGLLVTREITTAMISTMADRMKAQVRGAGDVLNDAGQPGHEAAQTPPQEDPGRRLPHLYGSENNLQK
jgi:hypothetical protein